ncbi:energy transducer TonB family protein [Rhodopseudomonas palustris]|uniref:Energy transducer TonB n=1 Tax=Rhodopseudomonas palustris TaxID=1076 RepID=A0A418VNY7_RHOPL|nr:energy transducer TonB [Rhodopseudomonas palustris]RJF77906.1 energy transducer TonB [Rhodopseudomonas palustris]
MNEPANAYALHDAPGHSRASQWLASAIAIVAAHLALIAAALAWYQQAPPPGVEMPTILVDLSPAPAAPAVQPQDLAPGPTMQQAPEPAEREKLTDEPERRQAEVQPQLQPQVQPEPQPVPVAPAPEVALPPPAKPVEHAKPAEPTKSVSKPKPEPKRVARDEPKRKRAEAKPDSREPPAPRTTAAPRAERQASLQSAAQAGRAAAAAALPSYRDRLAAHLARYKQYPSASKSAGEQGTALLSFTVGRSGQVLASRLARSSGHPALDAETLAMIRRAQPLPSFPPEMTQASLSFTVPVNFSLR